MTIFIDASALISIVAGESDADALARRLDLDGDRYTSSIAIWESVAGLRKSHALGITAGRELVEKFRLEGDIKVVPIDRATTDFALDAYERFGKGRHSAALNMGDCFAYACARALGASLLYKGEDFARTDLG